MKITNEWGDALHYEVYSSQSIPESFGKGNIENGATVEIDLPETNYYRVRMANSGSENSYLTADAVDSNGHIRLSVSN